MATKTTRTVTTRLTCGCVVDSEPGVYAVCPRGHDAMRPDHLTKTRRR